jgi:hypothetical protein
MADRFYINTTNLVTFAAGERPSADKFNAVNKYFSRGLESLAKVIGDAHDDGAPHGLGETQNIYLTNRWNKSSSKNRPLDILNLARLIGPASNLNPRYLHRATTSSIDEVIPVGVLEYYTNFPLGSLNTNLNEILLGTVVDFSKSMIRFPEETTGQVNINYSTKGGDAIEGGPNYIDAEFNVIPDPNTPETEADYNLTITETLEGDYTITLPTTGYQQSKLLNRSDTNIDASDPNNNLQIQLPFWMESFVNGQVIPSGSIYLKDRTTGESFLDATYTYISLIEVKVSSVELCLTEDHVFCLVTVGTDITTSIDDIRTKLFMHKHDGSFGESRISIYDLKDVFKHAPPSGPYKESSLSWNAIPQYLHRDGWQEDEDSFNGDNGMRGPLMMNLVEGSDENSNSIYLGKAAAYIKRFSNKLLIENTEDDVEIKSEDNSINLLASKVNINNDFIYEKNTSEIYAYLGRDWDLVSFTNKRNVNTLYEVDETFKTCKIKFNYSGTLYPQYQFGQLNTTEAGLDPNILLVDGLNGYYSEVSDSSGNLTWTFSGFDSEEFIEDFLIPTLNTKIVDVDTANSGREFSLSIVSNELKAHYILELWDKRTWDNSGDPLDGTPAYYEMLLLKPWENGDPATIGSSYRYFTCEIDRGLPWHTHILSSNDFSKDKEYKTNFIYTLNAFPYYNYGYYGKRPPKNYLIFNYELGFLSEKIHKVDCSLIEGINTFVRIDNGNTVTWNIKVEEYQNVKIKISMNDMLINGTVTNPGIYNMGGGIRTFAGLSKVLIEETLIDNTLYLEAKAIIFGSRFYYRKFTG